MTAENAIWYMGDDTLTGQGAMLRPLEFDAGANTVLEISIVAVSGDTVTYDMIERNDLLTALGIPALHRFGRMIVRGGRIYRISPRRPPLEQVAFVDCVPAFREWLKTDRPEAYSRLWLGGAFSYFGDVGEEMPRLLGDWNRSRRTQRMQACQLTPDKADGRLRRPQLIGRR